MSEPKSIQIVLGFHTTPTLCLDCPMRAWGLCQVYGRLERAKVVGRPYLRTAACRRATRLFSATMTLMKTLGAERG